MSEPYLGEIRLFGFQRIPDGWYICDGSLKPIAQNEALYTLLGTTYGGDGVTTFGVPDLRGRVPIHQGTGNGLTPRPLGQAQGSETVTLTPDQMAQHSHAFNATTAAASSQDPSSQMPATIANGDTFYATNTTGATAVVLAGQSIGNSGQGLPHENTMPTLVANFCIAAVGIFPMPQ